MKKILFSVGFILLASLNTLVMAQSYNTLWKNVQSAIDKDLPKTALEIIEKIQAKAQREHNEGQRLQSLFARISFRNDIAPDSTTADRKHLEHLLSTETRPEMQAIYHLALARLYFTHYGNREESNMKALSHLKEVLTRPDLLRKSSVRTFLPAFIMTSDGNIYDHDLLSPLSRETFSILVSMKNFSSFRKEAENLLRTKEHELLNLYRKEGARCHAAVVLLTLDSLQREQTSALKGNNHYTSHPTYRLLNNLIHDYASTPAVLSAYASLCEWLRSNDLLKECLEQVRMGRKLYPKDSRTAHLDNIEKEILQPRFQATIPNTISFPGQDIKIKFRATNINRTVATLYKLPLSARDSILTSGDVSSKKFLRQYALSRYVARTIFHTFPAHEEQESFSDSMTFSVSTPGVYLLKLECAPTKPQYELLHISKNRLLTLRLPNGQCLLAAVDAQSGHPLPNAQIYEYKGQKLLNRHKTGEDGTVTITVPQSYTQRYCFYVETQGDNACPGAWGYGNRVYGGTPDTLNHVKSFVYTDRSIYRPGQTLYASAVLYDQAGDEVHAHANDSCRFALRNASGKEIAASTVPTDEYGTASVHFELPENGLPGNYFLKVNGKNAKAIRIEEYKRPTFYVMLDDTQGKTLRAGDTLNIGGWALNYSGASLVAAKVKYKVQRSEYYSFFPSSEETIFEDSTTTNAEGQFNISVPLIAKSESRFCRFVTDVEVLSSEGETETARMHLNVGHDPLRLSTDWPTQWCKDHFGKIRINVLNSQSQDVGINGSYNIIQDGKILSGGTFTSGTPFVPEGINNLFSGHYTMEARIKDTDDSLRILRQSFCIFSLTDSLPADTTSLGWFYATGDELSASQPLTIQVGTPQKDVTLFYRLFSGKQCVESRQIKLNNSISTFSYTYNEKMEGDGLVAVFGFVKNGLLFRKTHQMRKPIPNKHLTLRWSSFRNNLKPGAHETWRLRVLDKDGKNPVSAQILALLYDASLDKFGTNSWDTQLHFSRSLINPFWNMSSYSCFMNGEEPLHLSSIKDYSFDHLSSYWPGQAFAYKIHPRLRLTRGRYHNTSDRMLEGSTLALYSAKSLGNAKFMAKEESNSLMASPNRDESTSEEETPLIDASLLRTDFSETAFFIPTLRTDENGEASICFTLPQSLTSWRFRAVAHSKLMEMGRLDTTITAQKDFMVTTNLPRFLRSGDNTVLISEIRNLTQEHLSGHVRMEILNAENNKVLLTSRRSFDTEAGGHQTVSFAFAAPDEGRLLVCRVLAESNNFSDGEQHYLPLLPRREHVIETVPFSVSNEGTHLINLGDTLFARNNPQATNRSLLVEYSDNPSWYVLQALPQITEVRYENALELASACYATGIAAAIAQNSPELRRIIADWNEMSDDENKNLNPLVRNENFRLLRTENTPWVNTASEIAERRKALAELLDIPRTEQTELSLRYRLSLLQQNDGSWSWFRGMPGNYYITLRVSSLLTRLQELTATTVYNQMIAKAMNFLTQNTIKRVAEMKKAERQSSFTAHINEDLLRFLDIFYRLDYKTSDEGQAATDYLLKHIVRSTASYNMYEKALCIGILTRSGHRTEALAALQSLMEHTVCTQEAGRYFDTNRAPDMWNSYKMPTQVAALEALRTLCPNDNKTIDEMTTWIIRSKRTTNWDDDLTSVDATYALLLGNTGSAPHPLITFSTDSRPTTLTLRSANGRALPASNEVVFRSDALGYQALTFPTPKTTNAIPTTLVVDKSSTNISWGSVFCSYDINTSNIRPMGNGLRVSRTLLRQKDGHWTPLEKGEAPSVGTMLRIRYKLTADRDYDFVQLTDQRPACFEPVSNLSGYDWRFGVYRAVKDASTTWFFEHFAKGEHTIDEDVRVDRSGSYLSGSAALQCCYAPEFIGYAPAQIFVSSKSK